MRVSQVITVAKTVGLCGILVRLCLRLRIVSCTVTVAACVVIYQQLVSVSLPLNCTRHELYLMQDLVTDHFSEDWLSINDCLLGDWLLSLKFGFVVTNFLTNFRES